MTYPYPPEPFRIKVVEPIRLVPLEEARSEIKKNRLQSFLNESRRHLH